MNAVKHIDLRLRQAQGTAEIRSALSGLGKILATENPLKI